MAKNKEKAGAGRTIVILLVVLLLLLTAGAYGYGVYYFSSHFLPGSMVNGFNCSYMASEDTEDLLNQRVGAYVLAVETMKNGQEAISAQDVGLSYVSTGIVKQLIKDQDRFTWFLAFNQDKNYDISESLSYNVELMGQAVDNLKCMQPENVVQPVDAQIQDTGDTFEIIPEVMGNALDRTKTEEVISAAMLRGKTSVNLENESCYRKPSVYSTDEQLKANCEKMNQLVKVIITYDFADRTETVDRTLIKNWFGYDEAGNVILDENLVRQYVADLGLKYDTMGQTRTFLTYDNRQVEIKGGDYGWVIDQDEEVKALIAAIESGVTQVREPVYLYSGYSRGTNDIGSTYVEIDLTNQHLIHKTGCRKHQHDRNEYVHKPYLPAFPYFSVSTYFPSIRYISLSITVLFLPRQQLYQHTPDRQHQCPAGARHNLCKWKQFHPFRTAEHRHISGTAHVRRTHPRCDR